MVTRRRQPVNAAILSVALLVASSVASVTQAVEPSGGGSTAGTTECSLHVAATGGVFAKSAAVVPLEDFRLSGPGYLPLAEAELIVIDVKFGTEQRLSVQFGSEPPILWYFFTEASVGPWTLTLSQDDPACSSQVEIDVLPLDDILDSKFLVDIKWLFVDGITSGCSGTAYCPDGRVTRGQMATFLVRALSLPPTSTDYFTDDEGSVHEANINRIRAAGITAGCTPTTFCPNGLVTRGQMATFLVRAFNLAPTATDYFTDDETNKHEANINRLRAVGITFGCTPTTYCPNGLVTRGQMAAFLHRAFE